MIRRPPRSTLFPTRRSSDLRDLLTWGICKSSSYARSNTDDELSARISEPELDFVPNVLQDRKSTRLNSSHSQISYAVFCLKKKKKKKKKKNYKILKINYINI